MKQKLNDYHYQPNWDAPTKEEIEAIKASWKEHGFPDISMSKAAMGNNNDKQGQVSPEADLWMALIIASLDDATGDGAWSKRAFDMPTGRHEKADFQHTFEGDAIRWFASDDFAATCELLGLDVSYMRKKIKQELQAHESKNNGDTGYAMQAGSAT